jgi:hypothetical protein
MFARTSLKRCLTLLKIKNILILTVPGLFFISSLPILGQQINSPQNGTTVKAYPCPAALIEDVTKQLKEEFQGQPDVRITPDYRTAQILVYASTNAQASIAQRIDSIKSANNSAQQNQVQNTQTPQSSARWITDRQNLFPSLYKIPTHKNLKKPS